MKPVFAILLLICGIQASAQPVLDSLEAYGQRMLNDQEAERRKHAGLNLGRLVDSLLRSPNGFPQPTQPLKSISVLESPDHAITLITWNIPLDSGRFAFHGRIAIRQPYQVIELVDVSSTLKKPESKVLSKGQWYGAIYYQIGQTLSKKHKTYTLLGWNGNNAFSNQKIIDILQVARDGSVQFGAPVFQDGKRNRNRVIFEFSEKTSMSLRFQDKGRSIVFDHLSPPQAALEGNFAFYGPDFTYDAYRLKKGKWVFEKNIDARNEDENKGRLPRTPEKGLAPAAPAKKNSK